MVEIEKMISMSKSDDPLKSVIKELTFDKVHEDATEYFKKLLNEGFSFVGEHNFPAHSYFKEKYKDIMKREGLIDAWLSFICFCIFAQGVSVGRNVEKIGEEDIKITQNRICDKWPECTLMRLKKFSLALDNVINWYDKERM